MSFLRRVVSWWRERFLRLWLVGPSLLLVGVACRAMLPVLFPLALSALLAQ